MNCNICAIGKIETKSRDRFITYKGVDIKLVISRKLCDSCGVSELTKEVRDKYKNDLTVSKELIDVVDNITNHSKPLDDDFAKILSDNILDLF